jgi:SAM-dependent methyltransferase
VNDKVDFDAYTSDYNRLLKEGTQFFSPNEAYFAAYKVEEVRRVLHESVQRILEFGCGIGRNIPFLQRAFPDAEIVGTDVSEASLEQAATENPHQAFHVESPALSLGHFDLIFVAGVYHHIAPPERTAVTRLLRNRLKPAGSLCVFEHNPYNPVTRRIVKNCPYDADAVLLKPSELKDLLRGAGLQNAARRYCLFVPPRLGALRAIERLLTWLPLGGQYWVHARAAV